MRKQSCPQYLLQEPLNHGLNVLGNAVNPEEMHRDGRYQVRERAINSEIELLTGTDQVSSLQLVQLFTPVDNSVGFLGLDGPGRFR